MMDLDPNARPSTEDLSNTPSDLKARAFVSMTSAKMYSCSFLTLYHGSSLLDLNRKNKNGCSNSLLNDTLGTKHKMSLSVETYKKSPLNETKSNTNNDDVAEESIITHQVTLCVEKYQMQTFYKGSLSSLNLSASNMDSHRSSAKISTSKDKKESIDEQKNESLLPVSIRGRSHSKDKESNERQTIQVLGNRKRMSLSIGRRNDESEGVFQNENRRSRQAGGTVKSLGQDQNIHEADGKESLGGAEEHKTEKISRNKNGLSLDEVNEWELIEHQENEIHSKMSVFNEHFASKASTITLLMADMNKMDEGPGLDFKIRTYSMDKTMMSFFRENKSKVKH